MWCFWKNKCGHWRIKKRKKWIDQREEECTMKEKEKQGGAFPAGKLIRDHFPNLILFLPSLFLSLHLFCFFMDWIHLNPTVKHFSVQMTAVEQLKHKSESGWLWDLYNRFERRWKNRENGMRKYRLRIKMVSQITYFCYTTDSQQFCPTNWRKMASFYLIVQH